MVSWTISAAIKAKLIDHVVVSSDSVKIIRIAKKYGALAPFVRPKNLSNDKTTNYKVVLHTLKFMEKKYGMNYDILILLQPTSPVRSSDDIDNAIKKLWNSNLDTVVSVKGPIKTRDPNIKKISNNYLKPWCSHIKKKNMKEFFLYNKSIYGGKKKYFLKHRKLTSNKEIPIIMDQYHSIDVDEKADFLTAEFYLKILKKNIKFFWYNLVL